MAKREFDVWAKGTLKARIYPTQGPQIAYRKREPIYRIMGLGFEGKSFSSREAAHELLKAKGFRRISEHEQNNKGPKTKGAQILTA